MKGKEKLKTTTTKNNKTKKLKLKSKYRHHFSFKTRMIFNVIIFLISFSLCFYVATKTIQYTESKVVNYNENNNIDYKVFVKPNDFYEQEYLDKNMIYVASLIDKISIDFSYLFNIDEKFDVNFNYRILGDLIIANSTGNTNYFNKQYVLLDTKSKDMTNDTTLAINENIDIDYDYYNTLASSFNSSYGLDTNSYLKVYLEIDKKSKDNKLNINDKTESSIIIPLSKRSIEIKFDSKDTLLIKKALTDKKMIFNYKILILEIILFTISAIYISKIIKLLSLIVKNKSNYDKFLNKILKEYDRLIVETTTGVDFNNSNIIKINKFNELLDVRDNLKIPIMYYNVVKHQKCYFYIKNINDVYLLQIKASDMEVNKDNAK